MVRQSRSLLYCAQSAAFDERGIDPAFDEGRVAENLAVQRDRGLDAFDAQLAQGPLHAVDRLAPRRLVHDQLADHRIVVRRHDVARVGVRIEPHAEAAGHDQLLDLAGRRLEVLAWDLRR